MRKLITSLLVFLIMTCVAFAQSVTLKGQVTNAAGEPLPGVNVQVENEAIGVATDPDGLFILKVDRLPVVLVFSYVGYNDQRVTVNTDETIKVVMEEALIRGGDVTVVGSRFRPRTAITTPVPIDNIKVRELYGTTQTSFDKMLHYVVPSFNSTQQTISDATAHFDPADLRGLGPSRTLVLINGKRKNASALVYINDTPGKGDVGVDMASIPVAAIKRVEVLRDGASAQYGSDAIAGVINVILNDETDITNVNVYSGVTQEGDGVQFGTTMNTGAKVGTNGFINITASYTDQEETDRSPSPGKDLLFGNIFGDESLLNGTHPWLRKNPDMGMRVGLPNMTSANVFYNAGIETGSNSEVYSFGGLVYREGLSYALYRAPYWIPDDNFLFHKPGEEYNGFQPTFETSIFDAQWTTGFRSEKNGWKYDVSYSYGKNSVDYTVGNSLNLDLGAASPTRFRAGGYEFKNNILNLDASKLIQENVFLSFGAEFRQENFIAKAGEEASYFGAGAQSFPGLQPQNEADAKRINVGGYVDLGVDVTKNLFLGGAVRYENYSDFGTNTTFKVNGRIKTSDDKFSVRGSASTGFRAPSLHQIHLSIIQTLVSGGTVSNQGTFNNNSPVLRKLGVNLLKEENSTNYTFGFAARPMNNLFVSVDGFLIDLDDRIVYSSSIASSDPNSTVGQILQENNITSLKFFINAVDTRTKGIDVVLNYLYEKWSVNAAATFYDHEIRGKINTPSVLANDGIDIFDRKEQSRILSARPNTKVLVGLNYNFKPVTVGLSANYFGEVTWQHASDPSKDQTFSAKTLFDLNLEYKLNKNVSISALVNNLMDTYPDKIDPKGDFVTDLGGRFQYPWEVNQFGFNGRTYLGRVNIAF